jgi:hypothetical protein
MVVMMLVGVGVDRNHASRLRDRAIHMLELHSGMADVKLIEQHMVDVMQNAVAG